MLRTGEKRTQAIDVAAASRFVAFHTETSKRGAPDGQESSHEGQRSQRGPHKKRCKAGGAPSRNSAIRTPSERFGAEPTEESRTTEAENTLRNPPGGSPCETSSSNSKKSKCNTTNCTNSNTINRQKQHQAKNRKKQMARMSRTPS